MTDPNVRSRVAVITGATGRLGARLVDRFVREGAQVAAVVRNAEEAGRVAFPADKGGRAFEADLADEAAAVRCFEQIREHFGRIDVLVHAAGGWAGKPLLETSLDEWERLMRINLTSAFLCFREAVRHMDGRSGRLIAFASASGADAGTARTAAYSAAKAGVIRLVEATAAELRGTGITANAVAPSTILYDEAPGEHGIPADDLVGMCVYLCSDAGAALNGKTLRAYGPFG